MMRASNWVLIAAAGIFTLSGCAAQTQGKRRGLEPTETNDGGLRQAPPPQWESPDPANDPAD